MSNAFLPPTISREILPQNNQPGTLFAGNQKLVDFFLSRFGFVGQAREDARTAALLGLWQAARSFDAGRGFLFSTYAGGCIRHALINHQRTEKRQARLNGLELDAPLGEDGAEVADVIADPRAEPPGAALVSEAGFERLMSALPERQRDILRAVYQEGHTTADVCGQYELTHQRVSQICQQALKTLRPFVHGEPELPQMGTAKAAAPAHSKTTFRAESSVPPSFGPAAFVPAAFVPYRRPEQVWRDFLAWWPSRWPGRPLPMADGLHNLAELTGLTTKQITVFLAEGVPAALVPPNLLPKNCADGGMKDADDAAAKTR